MKSCRTSLKNKCSSPLCHNKTLNNADKINTSDYRENNRTFVYYMNTGIYSKQSCQLKMEPVHRPSIFSFKEILYTQNGNFMKRSLMAFCICQKLGKFFSMQFKFWATARNWKWQRKKIVVARLYNVASKFLVCFE